MADQAQRKCSPVRSDVRTDSASVTAVITGAQTRMMRLPASGISICTANCSASPGARKIQS